MEVRKADTAKVHLAMMGSSIGALAALLVFANNLPPVVRWVLLIVLLALIAEGMYWAESHEETWANLLGDIDPGNLDRL